MSRRTVWIVNHYFAERERDGRTSRHEQFGRNLSRHGWDAVLIGASTVHPTGTQMFGPLRLRRVTAHETHVTCRFRGFGYRGRVGRVVDIVVFTLMLLVPGAFHGVARPDVVVGSSFHPLAAWAASRLARRRGVRFVFEPRDLWPETLVAFSGRSERSAPVRLLRTLERSILRSTHAIISPLARAGEYYERRGAALPFTWISNGTDQTADDLEHEVEARPRRGPAPGPFTVTYLGTVGPANALDAVVDAIASPVLGGVPVVLRVVGDGPSLPGLRARAARSGVSDRVVFTGRVPQADARRIGADSDCLVVNMRALPLYEWGVAFNKLFEYAALRRPIVCGANTRVPIVGAGAGVQVAADDAGAIARGIADLAARSSGERTALAERAAEDLFTNYTYPSLAAQFAAALDATTSVENQEPTP